MKKSGLVIIGVIVVLLIGLGIAARMFSTFVARKASDKIAETVVKTATGGNVDINSSNGSVRFNSNDGNATFNTTNSLPQGFPSDVPTPSVGTITGSFSGNSNNKQSYSVNYSLTAAQAATAGNDYKAKLVAAGYEIQGSASTTANQSMLDVLSAKKGDRTIAMTISTESDGSASMGLVVAIEPTTSN